MPFGLGFPELALIAVLFLFLFGGKRIADFGKHVGEGLKNLKDGIMEIGKDDD